MRIEEQLVECKSSRILSILLLLRVDYNNISNSIYIYMDVDTIQSGKKKDRGNDIIYLASQCLISNIIATVSSNK